ncbi:MAG: restriction endonuclease [Silvibacterium sp.]
MKDAKLPTSVRYVKNGRGGQWWQTAKAREQIHLSWKNIPHELLLSGNFSKIEQAVKATFGDRRGATQDFNALRDLLDNPSKHIWMTFEDGYMWWCTVHDGATANVGGEGRDKGNFWLACNRSWSNRSVNGKILAISDLPGTVTTTAGFQGTVCQPAGWQTILRIIQDKKDPDAIRAVHARREYQRSIHGMVKRLSPKDFEQLIDLILGRSGWVRICTLGGKTEGIDAEVENLAAAEVAFVQVKSSATQKVLDEYVEKFENRRDRYARMIFAVHSPIGKLVTPSGTPSVQLWEGDHIADLVVRLGLGEWIENRLA